MLGGMTRLALLCAIALAACDSDEPYETTMGAWCEIEVGAWCEWRAACGGSAADDCTEARLPACCDSPLRLDCSTPVLVIPPRQDLCVSLYDEAATSCPETVADADEACGRAWFEP